MKKHAHLFSQAVQSLLLLGLTATLCFARASPFGQVAQGVSVEVVAIVKEAGKRTEKYLRAKKKAKKEE